MHPKLKTIRFILKEKGTFKNTFKHSQEKAIMIHLNNSRRNKFRMKK